MMEWESVYRVAMLGFLVGIVFGAVVNKTNFCTMGAISDWINIGSKDRLRAWFLAIGVAILASQVMQAQGVIDLSEVMYLTPNFGWLGHIVGGLLFGIGMTLASGCGQRTLVRVGGGNLKSLVVLILLGLTAYMTMRGLLALVRVNAIEVTNIGLAGSGIPDQGMGTLIAAGAGIENTTLVNWVVTALLGGGLIVYAFAARSFRHSFDNILAGIAIGLIIPAGWYITGVIGFDDFDPVRLGSFLFVVATGRFRLETFTDRDDMIRHIVGGITMGFGGVLALGCTIGQGVTGMSTLALGSLLSLISIIVGSALTMKVQYYRLDDMTFLSALRQSLADMKLFPGAR